MDPVTDFSKRNVHVKSDLADSEGSFEVLMAPQMAALKGKLVSVVFNRLFSKNMGPARKNFNSQYADTQDQTQTDFFVRWHL